METTNAPAIRVATAADVPRLAEVLAISFDDDPVTRSHFPEGADRIGTMRRFFALALAEWFVPLGLVHTTEDLVGVTAWLPPGAGDDEGDGDDAAAEAIRDIFGASASMVEEILRVQAEHHPTEPSYYLQFMGTLPSHRRRGIGSSLLRPVLDMCDRERLPAFLDASSEHSREFYRRHGFEVVQELPVPTGAMFWQMRRPPP